MAAQRPRWGFWPCLISSSRPRCAPGAETKSWLLTYNMERRHDSLGGVPQLTFLPLPATPLQSNFDLSA